MDAARLADWQARFHGYREHVGEAEIQTWLQQFAAADRDTAARVLDATEFLSRPVIEAAFQTIVAGLSGWHKDPAQRVGRWFFMPLSSSAGESGDSMLYTLRNAAGLNGRAFDNVFVHKSDLLRLLPAANDSVVFVDDFSGTGRQAIDAWDRVLRELLPLKPRVYLVFVAASQAAIDRIVAKLRADVRISVRVRHRLRADDRFFENSCTYFAGAEKNRMLQYCTLADPDRPRGYGDCGFLIVLAHQCPNNSLPILYASGRRHRRRRRRFRGLFRRQ